MNAINRLFSSRQLYDYNQDDPLFLAAVKEVTAFHLKHCEAYQKILATQDFALDKMAEISQLPPLPTLLLKSTPLLSIPKHRLKLVSTTSGTSGTPVSVGFDWSAIYNGQKMLRRMLAYHQLFSFKPVHYLILGYQPHKSNQMGAARTANVATYLAPAKSRTYALNYTDQGYQLNIEGLEKALTAFTTQKTPVRILGFPSYFYFLLDYLKTNQIHLQLPPGSLVFLGGGWKQFANVAIDKNELVALAGEVLGLSQSDIHEFFGVVEHNVPYFTCSNSHFHIPLYSRVIIRDIKTLKPLPYGQPGLLNLITPLMKSHPLTSILTDDIAILHPTTKCGCGNPADFFEVLRRAGLADIKTCVNLSADYLSGGH
ncbi:MAG: hypothetical protein LBR25_10290 [Erysipelotrichaceae bacterium]|jgi:phenylacetate-coenzyme A ligase PaaK-like adenylate-forming protein|nr:hypothetical protein [Erysipelotrichaceae bacterium]